MLLVMLAFQKISDVLESKQIQANWKAGLSSARISFLGKNGENCEFCAKVEPITPRGEPFVLFNYDRGDVHETDFTGTRAAELTQDKILERFKSIFEPEI